MKKQFIISLVLVLGLTSIAQPSFAMKRNRPGHPADQFSSMISSIVLAVKWFLANELGPNHVTFVSQSGTNFNVPVNDLDAFLHLTPTIANMLEDLDASDITTIPLGHVSNPTLYLLTQMASGADHVGLLEYIRGLGADELIRLKEEANFLDSQALKDLISRAFHNPFSIVPPELLPLILGRAGPQGRTNCREVNQLFRQLVDRARLSISEGGSGCTDNIHVVATIQVGSHPRRPVAHGQMLYVANIIDGTVSVIDANTNQVVATIEVGGYPWLPVVDGQMLYVVSEKERTVSVIDTTTNQVVATIPATTGLQQSVIHGQTGFSSNVGDHTVKSGDHIVTVTCANTGQVVAIVQLNGGLYKPAALGDMRYVSNHFANTVSVTDQRTNQVVATIRIPSPQHGEICGKMLYVLSSKDDSVYVIDTNTNQVVGTIRVGNDARIPVIYGRMLYVVNAVDGTVAVIDAHMNQVVCTITVGDFAQPPIIHGQMLYVANGGGGTISVIDIGGYLPGQI